MKKKSEESLEKRRVKTMSQKEYFEKDSLPVTIKKLVNESFKKREKKHENKS